jgi:sRNA-binding protein
MRAGRGTTEGETRAMTTKSNALEPYRPSRTDNEEVIRMLCKHYPACFFEEARQRRPLKKNIAADIISDHDFAVAPEMIKAAVEWYGSHISSDYAMSVAGTKRVDLDGHEVGTVTKQEALFAKQRIYEFNARRNEQRIANSPVTVLGEMHAAGQIPDCAGKKLDALPMSLTPRSKVAVAPEFAPLYEMLAASNAVVVGISDPALRAALAKTSLDVVIKKFQQVRSELDLVSHQT